MANLPGRNLLHLVFFLSSCHALNFEITRNREIGTYLVRDLHNGVFDVGPNVGGDDEFDFRVNINTTVADQAGLWGLSQELSDSTRLACYENGECISQLPTHEAPILDGDENTIPFYGFLSRGTITKGGPTIDLSMNDGPSQYVLSSLFLDANGANTSPLVSFVVSEEFTVSLLRENVDDEGNLDVAHQCKWAYGYDLMLEDLRDGHTFQPNFQNCVPVNPEPPIVDAPVALENPHRVYDNPDNQPFNEPRFNVGQVSPATWKT